jgi:hypothetical protein
MECDDSGRETEEGEAEDGAMWDVEEEGRMGSGEEFGRAAAESGDGLPVNGAASA